MNKFTNQQGIALILVLLAVALGVVVVFTAVNPHIKDGLIKKFNFETKPAAAACESHSVYAYGFFLPCELTTSSPSPTPIGVGTTSSQTLGVTNGYGGISYYCTDAQHVTEYLNSYYSGCHTTDFLLQRAVDACAKTNICTQPVKWVAVSPIPTFTYDPSVPYSPPQLSGFISPQNNSVVSDIVTIAPNVTDNNGVGWIHVVAEGMSTPIVDTTAPFQVQWDTTTTADGPKRIEVWAWDIYGNNAGPLIGSVTVNNSQTPSPTPNPTPTPTPPDSISPTIQITQPESGTTVSGLVTINVDASDNIGVSKVEIYPEGQPPVTITSAPYTTQWDTTLVQSGLRRITAYAYDAVYNSGVATELVNVNNQLADTSPPTAPTNLVAQAVSDTQINLSWNPSTDNVGVSHYQIYRNNILIASVSSTSFGDINLSPVTEHSYYIVAVDAANNKSASSNIATATTTQTPIRNGAITGTITSSAGGVISGAKVSTKVGKTTRTTYTNSTGGYLIANIPPGSYSVTYSAKQHNSQVQSVTIPNGSTVVKNVTLQRR